MHELHVFIVRQPHFCRLLLGFKTQHYIRSLKAAMEGFYDPRSQDIDKTLQSQYLIARTIYRIKNYKHLIVDKHIMKQKHILRRINVLCVTLKIWKSQTMKVKVLKMNITILHYIDIKDKLPYCNYLYIKDCLKVLKMNYVRKLHY